MRIHGEPLIDTHVRYDTSTDGTGEVKEFTLYWKWDFDGNDTTDTGFGNTSATGTSPLSYNVSMSITATQVD